MSVSTLRLWLAGPLQSWGTSSRFEVRTTDLWPSKSGVIGLLAAALGRGRSEPIDDLAALRFGVREVHAGTVLRDFHTAGAGFGARGVAVASGARSQARGIVSERYYLQDAAFVVGFEGPDKATLEQLRDAVGAPRWPLALGRRSCPPADPLVDEEAVVDLSLHQALADPWAPLWEGAHGKPATVEDRPGLGGARPWDRQGDGTGVSLLLEDPMGDLELHDQPVGRAFAERTFTVRRARWDTVEAA